MRKKTKLDKQNQKLLVLWAADCAEHVLPYFEKEYPKDDRPRKAIEAGRAWAREKITTGEARTAALAAHAAARETDNIAARAAARSAGHAAATAHVASHAVHAANYALAAVEADERRRGGAEHSNVKCQEEREWQCRRLPKHLRNRLDKSHAYKSI